MNRLARPACALLSAAAMAPVHAQRNQDVAAIEALLDKGEQVFATGDLEGAVALFADDAVIYAENGPDIVGIDAVRATYSGMLQAMRVELSFKTNEIVVAGDLAFESGTFRLKLTDKAGGAVVSDSQSRHMHVYKRQPDGSWKTWRMMVNTPAPAPAAL
jgi:ketosteroid isomerase-like protein